MDKKAVKRLGAGKRGRKGAQRIQTVTKTANTLPEQSAESRARMVAAVRRGVKVATMFNEMLAKGCKFYFITKSGKRRRLVIR